MGFALEAGDFVKARGANRLWFNAAANDISDTYTLDEQIEVLQTSLAYILIGFFILYLLAFPYKNWSANFTEITLQATVLVVYCNGIWAGNVRLGGGFAC